jgi:hypothetical protein
VRARIRTGACCRSLNRASNFSAAAAPEAAWAVDITRAAAARGDADACDAPGCDAGPSVLPITAATSNAAMGAASRLHHRDTRPPRAPDLSRGSRFSPGVVRPAIGGTRPTGGLRRSRLLSGGAWTASCRAAESSLQNASAVGGIPFSRSRWAARALAAGPIGTSSSGGPSQSRGSRMTFSSFRVSPPPSSVRLSPVSTGLQTFLPSGCQSVSVARYSITLY